MALTLQCKYRNFVFSICVFIFCISFCGSWRRFDVLTLFVRTQRKSQRAIYFSGCTAIHSPTCMSVWVWVCNAVHGSVYHSIIISPQHVSKRQKVKNTERSRGMRMSCAVEPPGDARAHRHSNNRDSTTDTASLSSFRWSCRRGRRRWWFFICDPHQDQHLPRRKIIMWL